MLLIWLLWKLSVEPWCGTHSLDEESSKKGGSLPIKRWSCLSVVWKQSGQPQRAGNPVSRDNEVPEERRCQKCLTMEENETWQQAQLIKCYLQIWLSGKNTSRSSCLSSLNMKDVSWVTIMGWVSPFVQHLIVTIRKAAIVLKLTTVTVTAATVTTYSEEEE